MVRETCRFTVVLCLLFTTFSLGAMQQILDDPTKGHSLDEMSNAIVATDALYWQYYFSSVCNGSSLQEQQRPGVAYQTHNPTLAEMEAGILQANIELHISSTGHIQRPFQAHCCKTRSNGAPCCSVFKRFLCRNNNGITLCAFVGVLGAIGFGVGLWALDPHAFDNL
ncbi:MAG: hypothetical protein UU47_C0027G0009 [candidate division TM6 bacterium GW2011_GWE2_41_16]|nr:MAG: hypothetical protein UU47_C0027G0009 [candidate division TM6 bacterium GW2011_GWE2_41_16]